MGDALAKAEGLMFFTLSKASAFLAAPSNWVGMFFVLGILLSATRWSALGKRLVVAGIMLLLLVGFLPVGPLLFLPLTERFPPFANDGRDPDGIIILGGIIDPEISAARNSIEVNGNAGRITIVADLARRFPHARVVFSGGSGNRDQPLALEAPLAARLLQSFGVEATRITLEDRSRNTAENAAFTRELLQPKAGERWLLITSAYHMPRAIGCFRKVGFSVEAYPVDWQSRGWADAISLGTLSGGLIRTDQVAHEWLGLLVYRLTGRTGELFPGPQ
jgi:uncharacterized SAM-binding protein YcdF (DUF218 family)